MQNRRLITFLLLAIILFFVMNFLTIRIYENYVYVTFNNITSSLIKKYPQDESLIMDTLLNNNNQDILSKYGLTKETVSEITSLKKTVKTINLVTFLTYILLISVLVVIEYAHNRKLKKEIKTINDYLALILQNSYDLCISDYNEDEISILKNDIYKVAIKLKEYSLFEIHEKEYLKNTLEDISHQLKTPLTALTIMNDILRNNDLTMEEKKDFLLKQAKELEKMEWLITTLLNMSKLDSGSVTLKKEEVIVGDLIDLSLESIIVPSELKEVKLEKSNLDFMLVCDINWTKEAIMNILKNALEHVSVGGIIKIVGEDNPLYQSISITDNGVGISKNDIKNIFKRFYTQSGSKESVGIGLNLAKIILEKENGKIEVESEKNKYTTFKIIFYKTVV